MKGLQKGRQAGNYRPITCLPLIYKLLTGIINNGTCVQLNKNDLLPGEQKRCRKCSRGSKRPTFDR